MSGQGEALDRGVKTCLVVVDGPTAVWTGEVSAPREATLGELLLIAKALCAQPGIDWEGATAGIHGTRRERSVVPNDGERVELYRPLHADPRELRRKRLARGKSSGKRGQ